MFKAAFWKALFERAVKTFCQALAAAFALGTPIFDLDWKDALGLAGTAAALSILTTIGSVVIAGKPSLASERLTPPAPPK